MGKIYRVTVIEETTDAAGGYEGNETLFELAGAPQMIAKLAPAAIVEALVMAAGDSATAVPPLPAEQGEAPKARRPRRTKEQIAADEAAEAARIASGGPATPAPSAEPVAQAVDAPVSPPAYDPFASAVR